LRVFRFSNEHIAEAVEKGLEDGVKLLGVFAETARELMDRLPGGTACGGKR